MWAIKKLFNLIAATLVLGFILMEQFFWETLGDPIYQLFLKWRPIKSLEIYIKEKMRRWALLLVFMIPFIIMEVFAIISGRMFVTGHVILGIVFYGLKGLMTLPVMGIFSMGREKLLSFKVIEWAYKIIVWFKKTNIYQGVAEKIRTIKKKLKEKIRLIKVLYFSKQSKFLMRFSKYYGFLRKKYFLRRSKEVT